MTFQNSDTTKNGTISFARFKQYPLGSGSKIYQAYCTACHSHDRELVGPALTPELINSRTREWLYTFFKDRKHLRQDNAYLARRKEFKELECMQFIDDPRQDVQQLVDYLKE
ncbi:MAG TPA: cytochrome c [Pedobacter sp.]|nr:cytochrome c [Pedobacter sp.]